MTLDHDACYRAVRSRDGRFDGRFFTAVRTTGIYCRPVCPARTPLFKNVRFFACAAAAEEAGFRPCLRCRPESAPGTPSWIGTPATVSRALRFIEGGALDELSLEALAAKLGIGDRHLRRLFIKHLGTSPQNVAAARRTHFARTLLGATRAPMTEVALASGFRSVRQFNEAVRAVFRKTPTQLRHTDRDHLLPRGEFVLRLSFRPPFEWERLLGFLAARAVPGVEHVEQGRYRRTFGNPAHPAVLEAALAQDGRAIELGIRGAQSAQLLGIVSSVRRLFDLDADPLAIVASLEASPLLARSVAARPGLRVPGAWDRFETLVRAVLGQQISVAAATTLCARLVQRFGPPIDLGGGEARLTHLFPTPGVLATADLTTIGLPRPRAACLRNIAATVAADPVLLEPGPSSDELIERLCALPGIGPWTAHYVAMRAFSEPDAFPSGDLILRRAAGDLSAKELEAQSHAWRPFRAYAVMHLWSMYAEEVLRANRALAS